MSNSVNLPRIHLPPFNSLFSSILASDNTAFQVHEDPALYLVQICGNGMKTKPTDWAAPSMRTGEFR